MCKGAGESYTFDGGGGGGHLHLRFLQLTPINIYTQGWMGHNPPGEGPLSCCLCVRACMASPCADFSYGVSCAFAAVHRFLAAPPCSLSNCADVVQVAHTHSVDIISAKSPHSGVAKAAIADHVIVCVYDTTHAKGTC